jgi:hypothetical protein
VVVVMIDAAPRPGLVARNDIQHHAPFGETQRAGHGLSHRRRDTDLGPWEGLSGLAPAAGPARAGLGLDLGDWVRTGLVEDRVLSAKGVCEPSRQRKAEREKPRAATERRRLSCPSRLCVRA